MSTAAAISHLQHPPMSSAPIAPSSKRIIQKRWVCDVCKTKWFLSFDEACAHEAVCAGADNDGAKAKDVASNKDAVAVDSAKREASNKEVIEIADSTDSDASPVKSTRRSKRVRKDVLDDSSGASSSKGKVSDETREKTTASIFKPKAKKDRASKKETHAVQPAEKTKTKKLEEAPTKNSTRSKKEAPATKANSKSGVSQQLLAEHNAASFFAKRKQAQQEERERQKKREEARRFAKKKGEDDTVVDQKELEGGHLGVTFPHISHVLQGENVGATITKRNATKPSVLSYPHCKVDLLDSTTIEPMPNLSFFQDAPQDPTPNIHNLFSLVFEPSKRSNKGKPSTKLWTEKHTISSISTSILGHTNRQSATKLSQFIEEWKTRRHKSTLIKKSKSKRRRKSGYDSDDSFLDDECGGRTSLFLLTGPSGSGKSRVVHAVSSALDCVVMEIHSGEVRGGGVLKKRVLESTQSHSSVALMKKREGGGALLIGKGGGKDKEFFDEESSSSEDEEKSSSLTVILIDEVDLLFQDHGDTGFWMALSQLSQKAKSPIIITATSVPPEMLSGSFKFEHIEMQRPTIEECCAKMAEVAKAEGMALKESTQDVEFNEGLSLIAEYFQCDIRRILNEMQLFHASPTNNHSNSVDIAVFQRDWKARVDGDKEINIEDDRPIILGIEPALIPRDDHTLVTIRGKNFQTTEPATLYLRGEVCPYFEVASDSKILAVCPPLMIPEGVSEGLVYKDSEKDRRVKCYSSKFIDVVVRKRCANGLILDSSSCPSPHRSIWNLVYDVSTEASRLDQEIERQEFIRKAKANRKRLENEADDGFMSSDEEMEFEGDIQSSKKKVIYDSSSDEDDTNNQADKSSEIPKQHVNPQTLLDEALSEVAEEQPNEEVIQTNFSIDSSSFKEVEKFAEEMDRMSDVAFLEDALVGLPMLSGAMGGLGSQSVDGFFTDCIPADPTIDKLSKESHHLPGFENLCLGTSNKDAFFYGNADTYMVRPCRYRERFLLNRSLLHSRGLGAVDNCTESDNTEPTDPDDEESQAAESSKILSSLNYSEDDTLISPTAPSTRLLLSSLLGKEVLHETSLLYSSNLNHGPWLDLRINEMWNKALETMSNILAPDNPYSDTNWRKICFGIRLSQRFNGSWQQGQIKMANNITDASLSLDYFPYLRLIAFYENKVHSTSQKLLNGADQNTRTARSSKRRNPSLCRAHYLATDYGNLEHDLSELGDSYLINEGTL